MTSREASSQLLEDSGGELSVEQRMEALHRVREQALREAAIWLFSAGALLYLLLLLVDPSPTEFLLTGIQISQWKTADLFLIFLLAGGAFLPLVLVREKALLGKSKARGVNEHCRQLIKEREVLEKKLTDCRSRHQETLQKVARSQRDSQILGDTIIGMGQQLHDLAALSGDVHWILNHDGRIKFVSGTVHDMFGYTQKECVGRLVTDFLPGKHQWTPDDQEAIMKIMNGTQVAKHETTILHQNGTIVTSYVSVSPVMDGQGHASGFFGSVAAISGPVRRGKLLDERIHLVYDHKENTGYLPTAVGLDGLLQKHLHNVTQATESAAVDLFTQTQAVDTQLSEMLDFLGKSNIWAQEIGSQSKKGIEADRKTIKDLATFIAESAQQKQAELKRGKKVVSEINQLKDLVDIVYEISDRTNVLALNAGIIAARAGEHGHSFAVVASEVRKLSGQVKGAAGQIGQGISQSVETIESLFQQSSTTVGKAARREEDFLRQTAEKMSKMGDNYAKLLDISESTMGKITEWNQTLVAKVMALLSSFQFQDITRQQVEQVIKALDRRQEYSVALMEVLSDPHVDYHILENMDFSVESMFKDYVMSGQRETHLEQTGHADQKEEATPMIELF